jgi:hypothetical protein
VFIVVVVVVVVYFVMTQSGNFWMHPVYTLGYGLATGIQFPAGDENFFLRHRVQTGSGAHPASNPIGTGSKAAGV